MQAAEIVRAGNLPLTVDQVAEITRVTKQTVYVWIKSGKLHGMKAGRRWLTTSAELEDFIERSSNGEGAS